MKTLSVNHSVPNPLLVSDLVASIKDFGEDVYRALRDECQISLVEIDPLTSEFHMSLSLEEDSRGWLIELCYDHIRALLFASLRTSTPSAPPCSIPHLR